MRLLSIGAIVLVWLYDFEHMSICFGVHGLILKRHFAVVCIVLEKSVLCLELWEMRGQYGEMCFSNREKLYLVFVSKEASCFCLNQH